MRQRPKTTLPPHNSITVTVTVLHGKHKGASLYHEHAAPSRLRESDSEPATSTSHTHVRQVGLRAYGPRDHSGGMICSEYM